MHHTINYLIYPVGLDTVTRYDIVQVKLYLNGSEEREFVGLFDSLGKAEDYINKLKGQKTCQCS